MVMFVMKCKMNESFGVVYHVSQAIETGVGYGKWFHGEAVAAGMVMILYFFSFCFLKIFSAVLNVVSYV